MEMSFAKEMSGVLEVIVDYFGARASAVCPPDSQVNAVGYKTDATVAKNHLDAATMIASSSK
jgi:hypothetical protein